MNRKYTREKYLERINALRSSIPNIAITTDIMVGFPMEDESDFLDTFDIMKKVGYSGAFTFIYSPRRGTPAAKMIDNVPYETKSKRFIELVKHLETHIEEYSKQLKDAKTKKDIYLEKKSAFNKIVRTRLSKADKDAIAHEMARVVDIEQYLDRKPKELSGGQQQRVAIARALAKKPRVLLLDEPATGIDAASKVALYDMLGEINANQGVTIVMISHDLELAAQTAKSALCISHGICFRGDVHEALQHHHKHGYFYR